MRWSLCCAMCGRHWRGSLEPPAALRRRATDDLDARITWVGPDDRGVVLEVIAFELPDLWLVIHFMPTALRRKS